MNGFLSSIRMSASNRVHVLVLCLAGLPSMYVYSQQPSQSKIEEQNPSEELTKGKHTFQDLLQGNPEAVADEKQAFARSVDPALKQRIASILLSIGVRDAVYFNYLVAAAQEAFKNEIPWPRLYNNRGQLNKDPTNPEFVAWCKKHGLDPKDERYAAYRSANPEFLEWCMKHQLDPQTQRTSAEYEIPVPWYYLAAARDPRAYDLLVQGLHSKNLMIVTWAAKGLAALQSPKAVDQLIGAGQDSHGEARVAIAISLVYFSEPRAQAAAEQFSDAYATRKAWEILRDDALAKGPKSLFRW